MSIKPVNTSTMDVHAHARTAISPAAVAALPPPDTKRWVIRRKAAVVEAVRNGILTLEQACERYLLSPEELYTWQRLVDSHGLPGLRVTRLHDYRGSGSGD